MPSKISDGVRATTAVVNDLNSSTAGLTAALKPSENLYNVIKKTDIVGGGSGFVGGYFGGDSSDDPAQALKEYRDSRAAAAKDRIMRGLARALSRTGFAVDSDASAEEIARSLQRVLPNPRKGKTFAADAKTQENVCRTIADALNNEFTPGAKKSDRLIDSSLGAVSVCRQVSEIVHSLTAGLQTEFLEVHASLTRILRNLEILDEVLKEIHSKIFGQVASADLPVGADKKIADFEEVYSRAQRERERQMSLMRHFLDVTLAPAEEELAIAMREEGEAHDMIKRLQLVPGTSEFSDSLAQAISGLGTIAAVTFRVDKALKEIGLSVEEYLSSSDIDSLSETLDHKLVESKNLDDVGKLLSAIDTLKNNFSRRSELDFSASTADASTADVETKDEIEGSYEGGGVAATTSLDKRVEKHKMEKKLIVKDFINKSTRQYAALLKAVEVIGPMLGRTIPLGDQLENLRNALNNLSQIRIGTLSLELALLGYYGDAENREKKEKFLASLRDVKNALDEVMSLEMYRDSSHYFAAIRSTIDTLIRTIDFYSDVVAKKYGSGDSGEEDEVAEKTGGDSSLSSLPEIARSSYDLERAVNTFKYFYYVAKIRDNLAKAHKELEFYGEKYVDILGDAVAARIRQLEVQKTRDIAAAAAGTALSAAAAGAAGAAGAAAANAAAKTFIDEEYTCKTNFYRALQALDLYMKAFTDGIVSNPDDVGDIKRMLDGVSVIGRWFTEETGDNIAAAFDMMPAWTGADRVETHLGEGGHYYEKIVDGANTDGTVFYAGVPQFPCVPTKGAALRKQVAKAYDNFQALKNITNAFVRIGDKFGGKELRRQVFMSPAQIYKYLLDYMKCSALSMGVTPLPAVAVVPAAGPVPPPAHVVFGPAAAGPPTGPALAEVPPAVVVASINAPGVAAAAPVPIGAWADAPPPAAPAFRGPDVSLCDRHGADHETPVTTDRGLAANGIYFGSAIARLKGSYEVENVYFTFCVKAMAAKVLTVIGVFDLFERPSPVYELTPTRMIIGGASSEAVPDVIPEASELYFRLPRLVEFYKDLFDWRGGTEEAQISMLPEVEGVFSGIIRLIFTRAGAASTAGQYRYIDYTDLEVRSIVREVNAIYENFRISGEENIIGKTLSAFVTEINRRYGVVKKKDWETFQTLIRDERRGIKGGPQGTQTNYAILPGEEEEYESNRRAPSDRYIGPGVGTGEPALTSKFQIDGPAAVPGGDTDWRQWTMLKEFRKKLSDKFDSVDPSEFTAFSFSTVIRQGEKEIRSAEDASAKIGVAARLIQGSGNLAGVDMDKAFMFHETVVVGLNTLSGIYTLLNNFRQRVIDTDVTRARSAIFKWMKNDIAVAGAGPAINYASIVANAISVANGFTAEATAYVHADGDRYDCWGGSQFQCTALHLYQAITRSVGAVAAGAHPNDAIAHTLAIYSLNDVNLMRDLLVTVSGLTTTFGNLVVARFPGTASGQLFLDFSGLRDVIQNLMNDIRYFMDLFRPYMAKSVITRFEDRSNPGSLYWLEENLLDGLVNGLPDDLTQDEDQRAKTFEWMSRTINDTYATLVGYNRYSLSQLGDGAAALVITDAGQLPVDPVGDGPFPGGIAIAPALTALRATAAGSAFYGQYGNLLCGMVFYDAADVRNNSGMKNASFILSARSGIDTLISTARPHNGVSKKPKTMAGLPAPNDQTATRRVELWDASSGGLMTNPSMLTAFNQLLAKYLSVFYDSSNGRIYRGLIDGFANGSFSRSVMSPGNSLPDLICIDETAPPGVAVADPTFFGIRGDPTGTGILFQTLALILQRLVTDINPTTQINDHLISTLSEIPMFIRESFRANLPVFVKLFELVQKECDLFKQLMANTTIQVGRWMPPYIRARTRFRGDINNFAPVLPPLVDDILNAKIVMTTAIVSTDANTNRFPIDSMKHSISDISSAPSKSPEVKAMLVRVIDSITAGCYSISNCATEVIREIADEPLYMQTYENSIQEYKARYGKMPLMPLSSMLTYLRNVDTDPNRLFPEHSIGDQAFKLMYGTRKMLCHSPSEFSLADAPGVRENIDAFNASATDRTKIEPLRLEEFLKKVVSGLRFVIDVRFYRRILTGYNDVALGLMGINLVGRNRVDNVGIITDDPQLANAAYSIRSTPQETLAVTESSYQNQELKKISDVVGGSKAALGRNRAIEVIYNIIDININPINPHALMRTVPLAPIFNYTYTFNEMACQMFGETVSRIDKALIDQDNPDGVKNTRQMLLKMLISPYTEVPLSSYGGIQQRRNYSTDSLIQRIFRGDDSLMMGRPKFLSDQLYNKALFGSLVPTMRTFDEGGPPASGRMGNTYVTPAAAGARLAAGLAAHGNPIGWGIGGRNYRYPAAGPRGHDVRGQDVTIYGALTYLGQPDPDDRTGNSALKQVLLGAHADIKLAVFEAVSRSRFDTHMIRNMFFVSNVQRLMRLKLNQELTRYRNVLVSDHSVINPGVTEYGFMPPSTASNVRLRQFGPGNETSIDRRYDNETSLMA